MRHITRQMVERILEEFPDRFDGHMLQRRLLRLHGREFARELAEYGESDYPLLRFSMQLSRWTDRQFEGEIQQTRKVQSINLVGEPSQVQEWEKIR